MDWKTYKRLTFKELNRRKVTTLRPIQNSYVRIPEGSVGTIVDKHGGFQLEFDPCSECKMQARISKVEPGKVDLIEETHAHRLGGIYRQGKKVLFVISVQKDNNHDLTWVVRYIMERRTQDRWFPADWDSGGVQLSFPREIPVWLDGFLDCLDHYIDDTESLIDTAWKALRSEPFENRQHTITVEY